MGGLPMKALKIPVKKDFWNYRRGNSCNRHPVGGLRLSPRA